MCVEQQEEEEEDEEEDELGLVVVVAMAHWLGADVLLPGADAPVLLRHRVLA